MNKMREIFYHIKEDIFQIRVPIIILTLYGVVTQSLFKTVCPMRISLGYSCPACGLTRAAFSLGFQLDFIKAWEYNPTVFFWIPYLCMWLWFRYIKNREMPRHTFWLIALGIITLMCYSLRIFNLIPYSRFLKV